MELFVLGLVVVFVGIALIPPLAYKLRVPVVVAEVVFGIVVGRSFLDVVPDHPVMDFFAAFGLVYLMVLAGLEMDFTRVRPDLRRAILMAGASLGLPLAAGLLVSPLFEAPPLLMGVILSTTSLGLVLPLARELGGPEGVRRLLLASVVTVDVVSMFLLAIALGMARGGLGAEFAYSFLAVLVMFLIPWGVNRWRVRRRMGRWLSDQGHFELEVRLAFALVLVLAALSQWLGFHAIIGGFIAGLIISEVTPKASSLEQKLEGFGYGFFIPLFFVITGARVDLPAVLSSAEGLLQMTVLVVVGLTSKLVGVGLVGLVTGLGLRTSVALGIIHGARMSLIIASAQIALSAGMIDVRTFSALVVLAVVSAIVNPSLGRSILAGGRRAPRPMAYDDLPEAL